MGGGRDGHINGLECVRNYVFNFTIDLPSVLHSRWSVFYLGHSGPQRLTGYLFSNGFLLVLAGLSFWRGGLGFGLSFYEV